MAKIKALIERARHLRHSGDVRLSTIINNPDFARLGVPMASDREALIVKPGPRTGWRCEYFAAETGETTPAFHARLKAIARERGAKTVDLGHPANAKTPSWEREDREGDEEDQL